MFSSLTLTHLCPQNPLPAISKQPRNRFNDCFTVYCPEDCEPGEPLFLSLGMTASWLSCLFMSRCLLSSRRNHPLQATLLPRLGKRCWIFVTWEEPGSGSAAGRAEARGWRLPRQLLQRGCQPGEACSNSFGAPGALSHTPCQGRVLQEPACLGDSSPGATRSLCILGDRMTTKQGQS